MDTGQKNFREPKQMQQTLVWVNLGRSVRRSLTKSSNSSFALQMMKIFKQLAQDEAPKVSFTSEWLTIIMSHHQTWERTDKMSAKKINRKACFKIRDAWLQVWVLFLTLLKPFWKILWNFMVFHKREIRFFNRENVESKISAWTKIRLRNVQL